MVDQGSRTETEHVARVGPSALPRRDAPSSEITRHLLEYLLSGTISPGQKIPSERQLAGALDVGRSAVREAIKSLSLLGLLEVRQGDGTYLQGSTSDLLPQVIEWGLLLGEPRVYDLMEARTQIEVVVAGLAAERRSEESIKELAGLIELMRRAQNDLDGYIDADIAFHLAIAEASGNAVFAGLVRSIQSLLQVWAARVLESAGETASSLAMHEPIIEAIERRDVDGAREAMRAHMERANTRLRKTLASTNQGLGES